MNRNTQLQPVMAGLIQSRCTCCAVPAVLVTSALLDVARRLCPNTRNVYLDRGDGSFELDGGPIQEPEPTATPAAPALDVLSDRPARTDAKTRITLERATFA